MKSLHLIFFIFTMLVLNTDCISNSCLKYLNNLNFIRLKNQTLFYQTITPYIILSGKTPDDLGYPSQCEESSQNNYFTVKSEIETDGNIYTIYYGLCFSNACTANDLNQFGAAALNKIIDTQVFTTENTVFIQPSSEAQITAGAIVIYVLMSILIAVFMISSIIKWVKQCFQQQSNVYELAQVDVETTEPTQQLTLIEKISLSERWKMCSSSESNKKIISFSIFKILSVPIIIYGQLFYLGNFGSYNILAFKQQIYQTFYSKVAVFAYYLPDTFFFISGYLLAKKIFMLDEYKEQKHKYIFKAILKKFLRLYPIYIAVILIYWLITPTLHAGPVWFEYQQQTAVCNSSWWSAFLLIDNWFSNGCYNPAWFVQAQLQYVLIASIFFFIYIYRRLVGVILLSIWLVAMWVLMFAYNSKFPVTLQITTSNQTQLYFRSTYSHAPFYFFGTMYALISLKESVRSTVITYFIEKTTVLVILTILSTGNVVIVFFRPSIWVDNVLGLQLALCRLGVFSGIFTYFIPGIYQQQSKQTIIHKIAYYTYPIILVSGFITMSGFWCNQTFPYMSGVDLLNSLVTNLLLSIGTGILLGLMFDFRTFKIKIQ